VVELVLSRLKAWGQESPAPKRKKTSRKLLVCKLICYLHNNLGNKQFRREFPNVDLKNIYSTRIKRFKFKNKFSQNKKQAHTPRQNRFLRE
jgi:hypothetical protein